MMATRCRQPARQQTGLVLETRTLAANTIILAERGTFSQLFWSNLLLTFFHFDAPFVTIMVISAVVLSSQLVRLYPLPYRRCHC